MLSDIHFDRIRGCITGLAIPVNPPGSSGNRFGNSCKSVDAPASGLTANLPFDISGNSASIAATHAQPFNLLGHAMRVQAIVTLRKPPLPELSFLLSALNERECNAQLAFQCISKSIAAPWMKALRTGAAVQLKLGIPGLGELDVGGNVARCVKHESYDEYWFGFKKLENEKRATLKALIAALKGAAHGRVDARPPAAVAAASTPPKEARAAAKKPQSSSKKPPPLKIQLQSSAAPVAHAAHAAHADGPQPSATLSPSAAKQPPPRKKLGELLVKFCDLKPEEVEGTVAAAKHSGERFGRYLLRTGMVTPEQLCRAVAVQAGLPVVNLWTANIPNALNRIFPFAVLKEHNCVPFEQSVSSVSLAVAEPLKRDAVRRLEELCRKPIRMCVGQEDLVALQLDRIFKGSKPRTFTRYFLQMPLEYRFSTRLGRVLDDEAYSAVTLNVGQGGMAISQPAPIPKVIVSQPRHDVYSVVTLKVLPSDIHAICQLRWIRRPENKAPLLWRLGWQIVETAANDERKLRSLCATISGSRNG